MNLVRSIISVFLVALVAVSIAGWIWAGGQPSPKLEGARVVLTLCGVSAIGCMWLLWSAKPGDETEASLRVAHDSKMEQPAS